MTATARESSLRGKTALITGAGQGIGLALARALATEGCQLILSGRNVSKLQTVAKTLEGVRVLTVACDVRDSSQVQAMCAAVGKDFGSLDILINNAGIAHANAPVSKLPYADWKDVVDTNLNGLFLVTQAALPLLKAGSAIVNNLSIAAKRAFPGASAYAASKHGGLGFTKTLREELRPQGIRVIALLPGAADTDIWNSFSLPLSRQKMMSVETVAQAVVNALTVPPESTVEELVIMPSAGVL
ncbi:MAG TPA: SDR family NAD(P)-dependent oxidoreductase [Terriglobales bacterium]|jgi:NAD(P)-dependent dehydrogenase (short-subunit alcohol dehydrogenase family)